jgi:hypothetical protein
VPALAHFSRALGRDDVRVSDLFSLSETAFLSAPDPTEYFRSLPKPQGQATGTEGVALRLLTYNIALLDRASSGACSHTCAHPF